MIPGTGKETAALALARLSANFIVATSADQAAVIDAKRNLKLAERRELVEAGKLSPSARYPYPVALSVDHVKVSAQPPTRGKLAAIVDFAPSVERALNATATGASELWFDAAGNAFLSFENEEDATLFRLALDA